MIDFATLTGSMAVPRSARATAASLQPRDSLPHRRSAAGKTSGERVCAFPLDADYEEALDTKIADIKQCTLEGDADHILAARFLGRFIDKTAMDSHGPVGLQLQRRTRRRSHRPHRLRRQLGRGFIALLIADFGRNALITSSRVSMYGPPIRSMQ